MGVNRAEIKKAIVIAERRISKAKRPDEKAHYEAEIKRLKALLRSRFF